MNRSRGPIVAVAALLICLAPAAAQPTTRARAQASVHARALEARAHFDAQEWEKAVEAYAEVVQANPYEGRIWQNYGFALHSSKRYGEAIDAWTRSLELGFQPVTSMYNICCARALSGDKRAALQWLGKAMDAGLAEDELVRSDSDLDAIRGEPAFNEIVGIPPDGLSREDAWRFDIDFLARRLEQVHYDLFNTMDRAEFERAVLDLKRRVGELEDHEIWVGIQRILAMIGDGHTNLWPPEDLFDLTMYPAGFWQFTDGLFIHAAAPEHEAAAGARVVRIGSVSAEEAWSRVAEVCSVDNQIGLRASVPRYLRIPAILHALGIVEDLDRLPLVLEKDGRTFSHELDTVPLRHRLPESYVHASHEAEAPLPLWRQNNHESWWHTLVPEHRLLYVQYNSVRDRPDRTIADYCEEVFELIEKEGVEHLVIDMRLNGGGNNFLNRPLVHGLIKCDRVNRDGHLFVITGRHTFSAAMNGAADIEAHTNALFVGEPTGSKPNFIGESTMIVLPCSGLRLSCSSLYWQRSHAFDYRTWIAPDLLAELSSADYRENRDPAMEAILAAIEGH